jgi:NADPH-dependent glutamate synthase beta subunit-like oxidoreductase
MDVAKVQQAHEEDQEFVRQRRAAIDTLLTGQTSKTQRFAAQDVMRGSNVAKGFAQGSQRMPMERSNTVVSATSSSSATNKPTNLATAAAAIKANTRCKSIF